MVNKGVNYSIVPLSSTFGSAISDDKVSRNNRYTERAVKIYEKKKLFVDVVLERKI